MMEINSIRKMRGFEQKTDLKNVLRLKKQRKRQSWTDRRIKSLRSNTGKKTIKTTIIN